MENDFNMEDFVDDDIFLEDIENFNNPDEGVNLEDVVEDGDGTVILPEGGNSVDDVDDDSTKGEEDDDNEDDDGADKNKPNVYSSLAKVLLEGGITPHLNLEETKIESIDDLNEVIKNEINSREYADLNEDQKYYLDALRQGVPQETIKETINISSTLESISDDDIDESEELRQDIIKQYYISEGLNPEKAARIAKLSAENAEDITEAKEGLVALRAKAVEAKANQLKTANQTKLDAIETQRKSLEKLKNSITEIDELIPGNPVNPKLKDDLYKLITEPIGEQNGNPVNAIFKYIGDNPIEANIKLAYLFQATDGFKDFSKLIKGKAKSAASKELGDILNNTKFNDNGQFSIDAPDDNSYYGFNVDIDI